MAGDFIDRIDQFLASLPEHVVEGGVEVDQVYAHYQHAHPEFDHPDGGGAFYLRDPLFEKFDDYMRNLAEKAITRDGADLTSAMSENMEALSNEVYDRAPFEFGDLKASGHPTVKVDDTVAYDRPPLSPRLSPEELAIKSHLRYLFDPHRYDRGRVR